MRAVRARTRVTVAAVVQGVRARVVWRIAAFVAVPRGCGVVGVVVRDVVKIGLDVPGGIAV